MSEIHDTSPSFDGFSHKDLEAMHAAGSIANLLKAQLQLNNPYPGVREFRAPAPDGDLAVTVEAPDDNLPCRLGEIWDPLLPDGYFTEYTQLDVLPIAVVSTGAATSTDRDNYYVYRVWDAVPSAPEFETQSPEPLGIVVAGHVTTRHELVPCNDTIDDTPAADGGPQFTEVIYTEQTTDYYIAGQLDVTALGDAVRSAFNEGTELPPIGQRYV